MGKSFADYQAEHTRAPFPLPMPDGTTIDLPKGSIDEEAAVAAACDLARKMGDLTPFTGLEVLVGPDAQAKIAAAWGALPPEAWIAVMKERREFFGEGN